MEVIRPQLLLVKDLKPHELLIEEHSTQLLQDIVKDQAIYVPILVDVKTKVILDGHHRFSVAKKLKLAQIPCFAVDYFNENIVSVFPRRETVPVSNSWSFKQDSVENYSQINPPDTYCISVLLQYNIHWKSLLPLRS